MFYQNLRLLAGCALFAIASSAFAAKPNIVIVITDDQGYGDIGAHGNTMINTPAMDKLHGESVRLTNYHVDPTCAPTRAALMSGRYSANTGIWHTIMGRSMMNPEEETIAEVLKKGIVVVVVVFHIAFVVRTEIL